MFTVVGRVFAILVCIAGVCSIVLGVMFLASIDVELDHVNGWAVGPKVPMISQGFQILLAGITLGVLTDISDRLLADKNE